MNISLIHWWPSRVKNKPKLVYHNYLLEVSGDTAADIVHELYEDSKRALGPNADGSELTKEQWWEYQRAIWWRMEGKKLPARHDKRGAAKRLLRFFLEIEVLEEGPRLTAPLKAFQPQTDLANRPPVG